jgi:hypothetical protein
MSMLQIASLISGGLQTLSGGVGALENANQGKYAQEQAYQRYKDAMAALGNASDNSGLYGRVMGAQGQAGHYETVPTKDTTWRDPITGETQTLKAVPGATEQRWVGPTQSTGIHGIAERYGAAYGQIAQDSEQGGMNIARDFGKQYNDFADNANQQYGNELGQQLGAYDARVNALNQQTGALSNDLNSRWDARTDQGMGYLKDVGKQQRKDLLQQYSNSGNAAQMGLVSSGLGGTTAAAGARAGNLRQQSDSMNRLNDTLNRENLDAYSNLSGQALGARQELGKWSTTLGDQAQLERLQAGDQSINALNSQRNQLGLNAIDQNSSLNQYALNNAIQARQYGTTQMQNAEMMPLNLDIGLTQNQTGQSLGWQGAPSYVPAGTGLASAIQPLTSQLQSQYQFDQQMAFQRNQLAAQQRLALLGAGSNIASAGLSGGLQAYGLAHQNYTS